MSQSYEYIFPVAKNNGVALTQTPVTGTNLRLNGSYTNSVTGIVNLGFSSVLSTTSTGADLSAVTFNVTGSQNGVNVTDAIKGGAIGVTVTGVQYFNVITSISVAGVVPGGGTVSIGTAGTAGFLPLIILNTEKGLSDVGYALQFIGAANSTATVYQSLGNSISSGQTYSQLIANKLMMPITEVANGAVTIPGILQMKSICKNILVNVTNNQSALLTMRFLQL